MAQENLKPLKILVFSMGILLIAGTVLLFGLVLKKMSKEPAAPSSYALTSCPGGKVNLKGRGAIIDSSITGDVMRVTMEKESGQRQIATVNLCSGKILGTLTLDSDLSLNEQ